MRKSLALAAMLLLVAVPGAQARPPIIKHVQAKYQGKTVKWWAHRAVVNRRQVNQAALELRRAKARLAALKQQLRSLQAARSTPEGAIRYVFGEYADQALAVARCESGVSLYASNGQYQGAWQMGSSERATYGHGYTWLEQARAAYAYFAASGYDWSPWSCKPY